MLRGEGHAPSCCTVHTIASMVARIESSRGLTRHHPLMFVPFVMILYPSTSLLSQNWLQWAERRLALEQSRHKAKRSSKSLHVVRTSTESHDV